MSYQQRLYDNYVSSNKKFLRNLSPDPKHQDFRNIINLRRAMKNWLQDISRDGKVLDVACGEGNLLSTLEAEDFENLYGVDISPEQVARAQEKFPQVICSDALSYLEKCPNTFNLITAFDILEHFPKSKALTFLDLIHNALKPGGCLILQLPNGDSPLAGGVIYGDFTHEVTYTTVSLRHVLISCGFESIEFQEHGPQPTSLKGAIRCFLWSGLRQAIRGFHLIETGGESTGVYTRVMRAVAVKR